jgi:hypothetical protein
MLFFQVMTSCSSSTPNDDSVNSDENPLLSVDDTIEDTDISKPVEKYEFPDVNYGGADFTILNINPIWNFTPLVLVEEQTGEILNDAMYARNTTVEETFVITLKEITTDLNQIEKRIRTTVMAGDDNYDVMFSPASNGDAGFVGVFALDGLICNLLEIPELQLDKPWWDKTMLEEGIVSKDRKLYFAASDINLYSMQSPICMFFNEDMMKNLGLNLPYETVKKGEWTLDEFYKYAKAGANLNSDDSFTWNPGGSSIYGYTSWGEGVSAMIVGAGEKYIATDKDNLPYLAIENERFYNVCQKIADMLGESGVFEHANTSAEHHFEAIFRSSRALLMTAEIKVADTMRESDITFGIVPMPKYDLNQANYHTMVSRESPVTIIPVTNNDPAKAGIIMDAMAYLSHRDVTPTFYDITVSQKRLRNEESIEMLKIIRDSKFFNIGLAYGWINGRQLYGDISNSVGAGNGAITSIIEKYRETVNNRIEDFISAMGNK